MLIRVDKRNAHLIGGLLADSGGGGGTTAQQVNDTSGHGLYIDSSNAGSPQVFVDGVAKILTNDKLTQVNERMPSYATTYWDSATNRFKPDQDSAEYAIKIFATIDPDTSDQSVDVRCYVPDGIAPGVDLIVDNRNVRLTKEATTPPTPFGFTFVTPSSAVMVSTGIEIELTMRGTSADVYNVVCVLVKTGGAVV